MLTRSANRDIFEQNDPFHNNSVEHNGFREKIYYIADIKFKVELLVINKHRHSTVLKLVMK